MQGGVPLDALTEIRSLALRDAGAASGFTLALAARLRVLAARLGAQAAGKTATVSPVLWIGDTVATMEAGLPYAIGLRDFGLEPAGFLQASPRKLEEALWLAETALVSAAFAVVILEVRGNPARFGLTESRRLGPEGQGGGTALLSVASGGRGGGEQRPLPSARRTRAGPGAASAGRIDAWRQHRSSGLSSHPGKKPQPGALFHNPGVECP